MKTRARIIIDGKVQGVFYRAATKQEADRLGVKGFVRNLSSGEVEAVFEGEEDIVKMMIDFCKTGPPRAKVTKAEVSWEKYTGEYKNFRIKY
jgi:acylphosphatase